MHVSFFYFFYYLVHDPWKINFLLIILRTYVKVWEIFWHVWGVLRWSMHGCWGGIRKGSGSEWKLFRYRWCLFQFCSWHEQYWLAYCLRSTKKKSSFRFWRKSFFFLMFLLNFQNWQKYQQMHVYNTSSISQHTWHTHTPGADLAFFQGRCLTHHPLRADVIWLFYEKQKKKSILWGDFEPP